MKIYAVNRNYLVQFWNIFGRTFRNQVIISCDSPFYGDLVSIVMWIRDRDRKIVICFHCIHRMAHITNKYIVCMILALFVWNRIWNERNISTPRYSDKEFQIYSNCVLIFESFLIECIETRSFITRFNLAFILKPDSDKSEHFCSIWNWNNICQLKPTKKSMRILIGNWYSVWFLNRFYNFV